MALSIPPRSPGGRQALPPAVTVPLKARMVFWRQMATCLKGGMTLGATLHHVQGVTKQTELREAARKAQICVERGGSFAAWMKTRPQAFSRGEAALMLAGETSGELEIISLRIAADLENEHTLRRKLFTATLLNKFVVLPLLILVPGTSQIFASAVEAIDKKGAGLSMAAQQKLALREGLAGYLQTLGPRLIVVAILIAAWLALRHWMNSTQAGRRLRDELAPRIPLTGPLWRDLAIFRYLTALGLLTKAGIPTAAALEACNGIAGNVVLDEKFALAARLAREKNLPASAALERAGVFSDVTLSLLKTGEVSGSAPEMLAQAASYYESDVTQRLDSVPRTVGVTAFIVAALVTGLVVGLAYKNFTLTVFDVVPKFMGAE